MQDILTLLKAVPRDVESPASRLAAVLENKLAVKVSVDRNSNVLKGAFYQLISATNDNAWKQRSSSLTSEHSAMVMGSYETFASVVLTELAFVLQATEATTNSPAAEALQVDKPNTDILFGNSASAKLGCSSLSSTSSADMPKFGPSTSHAVSSEKPLQVLRRQLSVSRTAAAVANQLMTSQRHSFSNVPVNHLDATTGPHDFARSVAARPSSTDTCKMTPVVDTGTALKEPEADGLFKLNQFYFLRLIGRGKQGDVFLASDTNKNREVAIEVVQRPLNLQGRPSVALLRRLRKVDRMELLRREILAMKQCRHRNIIALYEVIDDPDEDEIYLVMKYAKCGSIFDLNDDGKATRQPLSPGVVHDYARQLCAGLQYLHRHCIVHCDIKPANILLDDSGTPLLCDFGVSKLFCCSSSTQYAGASGTFAFLVSPLGGQYV